MKNKLTFILKENIFIFLDYGQAKHQFEYFRIAISLFSLLNFGCFLIDYRIFLVPNGIVTWEVTNANSFWFEPHLLKISSLFSISDTYLLAISTVFYVLSLLCLMLGLYTRLTATIAFIFFLLFSIQLYPFLYGVDLYQSVCLLILCVFPSGYSLSLSSKTANAQIIQQQKIGVRGLQIYLALTYFAAGFGKMQMDSWFNGEFIFLSLSDPTYQLVNFPKDIHYFFYILSGIIVVFAETLYFVFILIPYFRTLLLLVIITMHLLISLFMGLVPFGLLLILINIVSWYPLIFVDIKNVVKPSTSYDYAL
ncbi:hypothetical protein GCM10028805_23820 [Spirosoma harenae]